MRHHSEATATHVKQECDIIYVISVFCNPENIVKRRSGRHSLSNNAMVLIEAFLSELNNCDVHCTGCEVARQSLHTWRPSH